MHPINTRDPTSVTGLPSSIRRFPRSAARLSAPTFPHVYIHVYLIGCLGKLINRKPRFTSGLQQYYDVHRHTTLLLDLTDVCSLLPKANLCKAQVGSGVEQTFVTLSHPSSRGYASYSRGISRLLPDGQSTQKRSLVIVQVGRHRYTYIVCQGLKPGGRYQKSIHDHDLQSPKHRFQEISTLHVPPPPPLHPLHPIIPKQPNPKQKPCLPPQTGSNTSSTNSLPAPHEPPVPVPVTRQQTQHNGPHRPHAGILPPDRALISRRHEMQADSLMSRQRQHRQ